MHSARRLGALFALPVMLLGSACDPCAGVASCSTAPHVGIQGRIVDGVDGRGAANTQVALVRTGGTTGSATAGSRDSVATVTDGAGNYQLDLEAPSGTYDVVVAPPDAPAYRVKGLALAASTNRGEAQILGLWVARPVLNVASELFYRANPSEKVAGAPVYFERTSGPQITPRQDYYTATTDADGRVVLLPGATASGVEDVVGLLIVTLPGALGTSTISSFHLQPDYRFHPQTVHRIGVGPQLSWIASIYDRATVAHVPGTRITFTRTGGIPITPQSFSTVTNQSGEFVFPLTPLAAGTLIGDLTIDPPAPFQGYVKTGIRIPTFDADANQFLAGFGVGPHLPWDGTVQCNGRPLAGVTVFAVRVGGIAADPAQFYATSDAEGHFRLATFKPREYGNLLIDLEFTVPAGTACIGLVQHNFPLPTIDFDSDIRYIANWELPRK